MEQQVAAPAQGMQLRAIAVLAWSCRRRRAASRTSRVRSTTRAMRFAVPSASTEHALVRIAGAATAERTAKGIVGEVEGHGCFGQGE